MADRGKRAEYIIQLKFPSKPKPWQDQGGGYPTLNKAVRMIVNRSSWDDSWKHRDVRVIRREIEEYAMYERRGS